jgi:hypothetical protein
MAKLLKTITKPGITMNGKGSGRRPAAKDNPNAYQDNYEKVFGTRAKKKQTKEKKDKK